MNQKFSKYGHWASLIIGIFGILLSIYFYNENKINREPTYVVKSLQSILEYPLENASKYVVLLRADTEEPIEKSLYLQDVLVFNNGKQSIKNTDVLVPLKIQLPENAEIIDAYLVSVTRDKVVAPEIKLTLGSNQVPLDFKILEEKDGFQIRLIYLADDPALSTLEGEVEGVRDIQGFTDLKRDKLLGGTVIVFAAFLVVVLLFVLFLLVLDRIQKIAQRHLSKKTRLWVFSIVFGGLLITTMTLLFNTLFKQAVQTAEGYAIKEIPTMTNLKKLTNLNNSDNDSAN